MPTISLFCTVEKRVVAKVTGPGGARIDSKILRDPKATVIVGERPGERQQLEKNQNGQPPVCPRCGNVLSIAPEHGAGPAFRLLLGGARLPL